MQRIKTITGWAFLLALVSLGGLYAWRKLHPPPVPLEARVRTAAVTRGPIAARVTATGTLSALVTVQVGSQVSGRIAELHADFNSRVKKGQLIARIDPQLFAAAVEQARANLLAAEGNLARVQAQAEDAERQAVRQRALAERQLIAQAELDTALSNAAAARASIQASQGSVAQAKAALNQSRVNLAYTNIHSPIDGVVISRNVDVGQTVAASLQAPTLFTIAEDLTRMQVDTNIAEADIGKLQPGLEASFTVDAFPQLPFKGRIRQIRNAPLTVQNVVTYDAVIDVENPELKLKPGMTANVIVTWAEADEVLRVPNAALRFRPPADLLPPVPQTAPASGARESGPRAGGFSRKAAGANARQVWVLRGQSLEAVPVQTGITDGSLSEITSADLQEGDAVVVESLGEEPGAARPGGSPLNPRMGGSRGMRRVL